MKVKLFFSKVKKALVKALEFLKKYSGYNKLSYLYRVKLKNKTKKAIRGYLFILPLIIGFFIFGLTPIFNSLRMAFADFAGNKVIDKQPVFITEGFGLSQFISIFKNHPDHVNAIVGVLKDSLLVVPLVIIFSLILALLLNRKLKGIKIFRMIFFIPVILLSGNLIGYLNDYELLVIPGLENASLQQGLAFYLPARISSLMFKAFDKVILILWLSGVQTLIFLAGLQKTNKPIYEAAAIDGATPWESFWKITFPSLIPLMMINIVYTTVIYASLDNDLIYYINKAIPSAEFGRDYASALAWILFMIELLVIGVYLLILHLANKKYE